MCVSYIPVLQVRQDACLGYLQYQFNHKPPAKSIQDILREKGETTYSGKVKVAAAKRLERVVDIMIQTSKVKMIHRPGKRRFPFRLGFATLTIPGEVREVKEVQKVFALFLQWLRYTKTSYVWKAEFQQRGQLHYHLILNRYLPWKEISHAWNSRLKKAGFLNEWAKEHGHFMPNSVDVRSVKMDKSGSMAKYLTKYLSKENGSTNDRVISKWWGASKNLMGAKRFVFEGAAMERAKLENCRKVEGDHFVLYFVKPQSIMEKGTLSNYRKWQKQIRDNL